MSLLTNQCINNSGIGVRHWDQSQRNYYIMKIFIILTFLYLVPAIASEDDSFSGWMNESDLDNYFQILNNDKGYTNYFDQGKRVNAVEGRWKNSIVQYRVKTGNTPKTNNWWFWWVNQDLNSFVQKINKYEKDKFQLVYAQSFILPDGTSRYQGVWHKTDDNKTK